MPTRRRRRRTARASQVTVHQTESRAILSWQTFNVGQKTTPDIRSVPERNRSAKLGGAQPRCRPARPEPRACAIRFSQPAPSQILGSIKAPGTVLILNQNGIIFGGTSQVNTGSLIATSLEIGRAADQNTGPLSIKQRDDEFLTFGFLGFSDQAGAQLAGNYSAFTFSAQEYTDSAGNAQFDPLLEGTIDVQAGAQVTTADQGFILLTGPKVINSGTLTASRGKSACSRAAT